MGVLPALAEHRNFLGNKKLDTACSHT